MIVCMDARYLLLLLAYCSWLMFVQKYTGYLSNI